MERQTPVIPISLVIPAQAGIQTPIDALATVIPAQAGIQTTMRWAERQ